MNDYTPIALNWFLFVFGTFITLIPVLFRKKFGFFLFCFGFVMTYNYSFNFLYYTLNNLVSKTIFQAMLLHVIACIIVYVSYVVFFPKFSASRQYLFSNPSSLRDWKYILLPAVVFYALSSIGVKSTFNQIMVNTQELVYNNTISNILYPLSLLVQALLIKIVLTEKRRDYLGYSFLAFILLTNLVRSFSSGSKIGVMGTILFLGLIYSFKKNINFKVLLLAILVILPNIFFFISMANIRNSIQQDNMWAKMTMSEKLEYVYDKSLDIDYPKALENFFDTIANRLHGVRSLSIFLERTPAVYKYWGGSSYLNILKWSVPRVMWNEKKMDDFTNVISYDYFDSSYTTNVAPFIWGEPYLNFGITGVLFFACVIGIFLKICEIILRIFSKDFFMQVFIVSMAYSFIATESNAGKVIPGIIGHTVFFLIFYLGIKIVRLSANRIISNQTTRLT